jgi:hypothetical protein
VPRWLWLWFPIVAIIVILGVRDLGKDIYDRLMTTEQGVIENGTVVILVAAIVAGVLAIRRRRSLPNPRLGGWLILVTLGCIYMAMEEVSWGQHYFSWNTPAPVIEFNDQAETNLHNVSSWFDQKPRLILELGTLIGGVIFTLWALFTGFAPDPRSDWRYWFWPTFACFPAATLAIVIRLPSRFAKWFDWPKPPPFDIRLSEVQELFFGVVLMVYLWSFLVRLRQLENKGQSGYNHESAGSAAAADSPPPPR